MPAAGVAIANHQRCLKTDNTEVVCIKCDDYQSNYQAIDRQV